VGANIGLPHRPPKRDAAEGVPFHATLLPPISAYAATHAFLEDVATVFLRHPPELVIDEGAICGPKFSIASR
jgi:hypothetical protein